METIRLIAGVFAFYVAMWLAFAVALVLLVLIGLPVLKWLLWAMSPGYYGY